MRLALLAVPLLTLLSCAPMQAQQPHRYKASAPQVITAIHEIWPTVTTYQGQSPFVADELGSNQIIVRLTMEAYDPDLTFIAKEADGVTTVAHGYSAEGVVKAGSPVDRGIQEIYARLALRFPTVP